MDYQIRNRIERTFIRSLNGLLNQIIVGIGNESDPNKIARKLKYISKSKDFKNAAIEKSILLYTKVKKELDKSWREAAKNAGRGNDIYNSILNTINRNPQSFYKIIANNASYITGIADDVAEWITDTVQKETINGTRASEISDIIMRKYPSIAKNKAKLIARTEVSKTQTALAKTQSEKLGLNWYIWRTSKDSRTRTTHNNMDGVLVNWDEPPSPESLTPGQKAYGKYHAGDTFNCRCYPEPVVSVNFISFPCRVYYRGQIVNMTKQQFLNIA